MVSHPRLIAKQVSQARAVRQLQDWLGQVDVTLSGPVHHSSSADQQAGALVPYLLGRTKQETWAFAIDASAYSKQEQLHDIAKQKGAICCSSW